MLRYGNPKKLLAQAQTVVEGILDPHPPADMFQPFPINFRFVPMDQEGDIVRPNQAAKMVVAQMSTEIDEIMGRAELEKGKSIEGPLLSTVPEFIYIDTK
jgi:hypothetical protein